MIVSVNAAPMKTLALCSLAVVLCGCNAFRPAYSSPGTFYVSYWNDPAHTILVRNGRRVATLPTTLIVPSEQPDLALTINVVKPTPQPVSDRTTHRVDTCYDNLNYVLVAQLSPNGTIGLCSGHGRVYLFDPAARRIKREVTSHFEPNSTDTSFAWLDNTRFAVAVLDRPSCPYGHLYNDFPTRIVTFSRQGRELSRGPCAFGIVAGRQRLAYLGEAPNSLAWEIRNFGKDPALFNDGYDRFHHTWSVDGGMTWHDGIPMTFDGNDQLVHKIEFENVIRAENGQQISEFNGAWRLQWSR